MALFVKYYFYAAVFGNVQCSDVTSFHGKNAQLSKAWIYVSIIIYYIYYHCLQNVQ